MNQLTTTAIVLSRIDYGEADRIITVLTPEYGKLRLMAKGVRRVRSKLAGGIELFSISSITFIRGRKDISTLVSTKLIRHFGAIISDIARVQLGYDLIKLLNKVTEDNSEPEYFTLLEQMFQALEDITISEDMVQVWFYAQLIRFGGHTPNLRTDNLGRALVADACYRFDYETMSFASDAQGGYTADRIKFLRLIFSGNQPKVLRAVQGSGELLQAARPIIQTMLNTFIRI